MQQAIKLLSLILWIPLASQLAGCSPMPDINPALNTSNLFLQRMQAGQYSQAYQLLSPKCKAAVSQQQMVKDWISNEKKHGLVKDWGLQPLSVGAYTNGEDRIGVTYRLRSAYSTSSIEFTIASENDQSFIQSFTIFK